MSGMNGSQAIYLSPNQSLNYLTNSSYYNALNQDLSLSTSNLYLSKLINDGIQQKQLIEKAASKGRTSSNGDPLKLDLDQQAQESILNNEIGRRYEIWFKNTQWQLNDDDGQTCCAQFRMKNILYTKISNQQELDCVEHTLEIESCKVQDLSDVIQTPTSNSKNSKGKAKKNLKQNLNNFVLKGKCSIMTIG